MLQLAHVGRLSDAREELRRFVDANSNDAAMLYNLACLDALVDDTDIALADLRRAFDAGFTKFRLIEVDRNLRSIREDSAFVQLVADAGRCLQNNSGWAHAVT